MGGTYADSRRVPVTLIKRSWPYLLAVLAVSVLALSIIDRVSASSSAVQVPPVLSQPTVGSWPSVPGAEASLSTNSASRPSTNSASRPPILTAWADPAKWQRVWWTDFAVAVPLGQFPGAVQSEWGAYPSPWPDTATQRDYAVHGYYDPATTTWISGGDLHLKMWRGTGDIHSAAVYPRAADDVRYGRFIEVVRVSKVAQGYKSAHLLWPVGHADNEVDFPENEWTTSPSAYVHYGGSTVSFDTNISWTGWHTYEIRWQPGRLAFYTDGKLVGDTTRGVPDVHMSWIIQNESALQGPSAPVNSHAQMDISYVEYDKYTG
jgi:Glycosyl hydrolases family 16